MTTLATLRPADDSAAAIRASIAAIGAERVAAEERLTELRSKRQGLLLTGTAKTILVVETEQRAVEVLQDQLDALLFLIEAELPPAIACEELAELERQRADALTHVVAAREWFDSNYPHLLATFNTGLEMEERAISALGELRAAVRDSATQSHRYPLDGTLGEFFADFASPVRRLSKGRLPTVEDATRDPRLG